MELPTNVKKRDNCGLLFEIRNKLGPEEFSGLLIFLKRLIKLKRYFLK
jgi:hypothetical protein